MSRRLDVRAPLVVASHNPGKVVEIRDLLGGLVTEIVAARDLGLAEPAETGESFVENAEIKARAAAAAAGHAAIADDSGLVVEALGGAPGIHSARWAGPKRDFAKAMAAIEQSLSMAGALHDAARRAAFVCALSLSWPDGRCETFEGRVDGHLVFPPRGEHGFGYDPIFVADGQTLTFGEMEPAAKHALSHRADAFRKLTAACLAAAHA